MGTGLDDIFAHSHDERPEHEWHGLLDHLSGTARLAERFATAFGSAAWGKLAGFWHDLGKVQPAFQEKLHGVPCHVDHAVIGSLLAWRKDPKGHVPLAFVIAGHHGGLTNLVSSEATATPLRERLRDRESLLEEIVPGIPPSIRELPLPELPAFLQLPRGTATRGIGVCRRRMEFWIRFLYSALVDADFLDTEAYYRPGIRRAAIAGYDSIPSLRSRLDAHLADLVAHLADLVAGSESGKVNRLRAEILQSCRAAAQQPRGVFSLSVPTGGGKTLSSMAFALRHAEEHGLQRVIAVIPYTSIIEQNAAVYGCALGTHNVIEHHSNLDPATETPRNRLASENWDAPVIVTTAVQFFESLFANRPARCRKLHNIAQSA